MLYAKVSWTKTIYLMNTWDTTILKGPTKRVFTFFSLYFNMFKHVKEDNVYEEWLKTAHLLNPPYDYCSFAELHNYNKSLTNIYYLTLMNQIVKEKPSNHDAISALKIFSVYKHMTL